MENNQYNFGISVWLGLYSSDIIGQINDVDDSNTVDGKPIYYLVDKHDFAVPSDAGCVILVNCSNITVGGLETKNNQDGILLINTTSSEITGNNSKNNTNGIKLSFSSGNLIADNIVNENLQGVEIHSSSANTFQGNNITNNGSTGYGGFGVFLYVSTENTLIENNIVDNNIAKGQLETMGIWTYNSHSNKIYHNNFKNNSRQLYTFLSDNLFDNGYPSGGNYWSDYDTPEEGCLDSNDDGFCDAPYGPVCSKDNYPFLIENGWEAPLPSSKWSFAIITDLHIGRGYGDYDGATYDDGEGGEEYYLTERLRNVVEWIINNKNNVDCGDEKCPIKFLAVLGDITDTAEKSEFLKAHEILDKLNDPNSDGNTSDGIPYVPVFGNHDVWPYTNIGEANSSSGETYFDDIFWNENTTNTQLLKQRLNFQRDEANSSYKNFALSYKDMNFIGLDFAKRKMTSEAEIFSETENWLRNKLNEYEGQKSVILFSHHPLTEEESRTIVVYGIPWKIPIKGTDFNLSQILKVKNILQNYEDLVEGKQILGTFGGHVHGYYPQEIGDTALPLFQWFFEANYEYPSIGPTSAITTEALMVGSNREDEYLKEHDKGIIKIVKVSENNEIDYQTNEGKYNPDTGKGKEFIALNPYLSFEYKILPEEIYSCVFFKAHLFTQRDASVVWDFGDGNIGTLSKDIHCYKEPGIYNVKLSVIDNRTFFEEYISREIEIKEEGIVPKIIKVAEESKDKLELISTELGEKVTEFGRTMRDWVLIKVKHSPSTPTGLINVHFEQATKDIDLTNLITDFDVEKRKSILYSPNWPTEIEESKILFIPK